MNENENNTTNGELFDPLNPLEGAGGIPQEDAPTKVNAVGNKQTNISPTIEQPTTPQAESIGNKQTNISPTIEQPTTPQAESTSMLDTILQEINDTPIASSGNQATQEVPIQSLEDIYGVLLEKGYDYVKISPSESDVELSFVKEAREGEKKFIKFPLYTDFVLKLKTLGECDLAVNDKVQEGKGEHKMGGKTYIVNIKTQPSPQGEIVFIKIKVQEIKVKKKVSIGQLLSFLGATSFVAFVLGGGFISFVVLNAKTVQDVAFFYSLGISLNDINTFISKLILIIFSILLFIEMVVLSIFLFKWWLTKKYEKRKKLAFGILSIFLFAITFSTGSAWMYLDNKVKSLPNWQEVAYGDVQIFDNDKLISDKFDKGGALLRDTSNLIGPITLKYDLSLFKQKEEQNGYQVEKFIWNFGNGDIEELTPTIIQKFDKKGTYNVSLIVEEIDLTGKRIEKKVDDIKDISISYMIDVKETKLKNGGIQMEFDASDLKDLGKVEWYFEENLDVPVWSGSIFRPQKIFYEEELIGLYIKQEGETKSTFDKIFVIGGDSETSIDGRIISQQDLENELQYTFKVADLVSDFGEGFIEEFRWVIEDKEIAKKGDPIDLEKSSELQFEFTSYGKQDIKVIMKDSGGNVKELTTSINITKIVKLKEGLKIIDVNNAPIDMKYESKGNEYFINDLGIPSTIKFDARDVRADSNTYTLDTISWDIGADGFADGEGKLFEYEIQKEGNVVVAVTYTFQHRKITDEKVNVTEKIYIEAVRKEALINFTMEKPSNYAPVMVRFDASLSSVKDDNIIKFIYDFGDGIIDERGEAIVGGHLYGKEGEYIIKLTVLTEKGKRFSTSKTLVLSPKPQIAEIGVSMKSAPIDQEIDFSSDKSEGQIMSYFWNFGDGNTSTEANPSHAYKKAGEYEVLLRVGYGNNNFQEDRLTIEIIQE